MARSSSGIVAGLTAAAVAAIGFLAYQASANAPDTLGSARPGSSASASPSPGASSATPKGNSKATDLPAGSGTGVRVVYSIGAKRVWLVEEGEAVVRTFEVMPSTVDPPPGQYTVSSRTGQVLGSDGVQIEHVVRFASVDGIVIGFSAAMDGSLNTPDPTLRTGGIRERRADGEAMWTFAAIGTPVVVVA